MVKLFLPLLLTSCVLSKKTTKPENFDEGAAHLPSILVIGDSLSSGVFASKPMKIPPPVTERSRFIRLVFGNKHSLESAQSTFSEYHHAATTTDQPWGIRSSFAANSPIDSMSLIMTAQWGGRTIHMGTYAQKLEKIYQSRKKPEVIFIWIGGNDFCRDITADIFQKQYENLLKKVIELHPKTPPIFISPLPKITTITDYKYRYSANLSCQIMQKNYCESIFANDRDQRLFDYNKAIETAIKNTQNKLWIDKGQRLVIHYVEAMKNVEIKQEDLSFDCFHPSLHGQKKFANIFNQAIQKVLHSKTGSNL